MGTIWVLVNNMKYIPYFTITPRITKDLEAIGAVFGYFRAVTLPESYKKELVSKVTAEAVHASTAIEGNTLTEKQVEDVLSGKKIHADKQDISEIVNYNNALKYIERLSRGKKALLITENHIKEMNRIILKGIRNDGGDYRKQQVIVGDYLPPSQTEVPVLMREFVHWLENPEPRNLSPILYTGIAHYELVAIHPFVDGNGRVARILTSLMLIKNEYDLTSFFSLESFYNRNRKAYYDALASADKYRTEGQPDLTKWLEYYLEGMLIEAERAKSKIEELLRKSKQTADRIWLSNTQSRLLQLTYGKKTVKISDYLVVSGLSRKGTYNAVTKLVKLELLNRSGSGKGTYYTISEKGIEFIS